MPAAGPGTTKRTSARDARDDKLILALLQNPSLEKAAASAGVSVTTLWRRTQDYEFAEKLRKAKREAYSQTVARLQHASGAAVSTLLRVMTDQGSPAASRVRAASHVLEHSARAIELDEVAARLDRLEELQSRREDDRQ